MTTFSRFIGLPIPSAKERTSERPPPRYNHRASFEFSDGTVIIYDPEPILERGGLVSYLTAPVSGGLASTSAFLTFRPFPALPGWNKGQVLGRNMRNLVVSPRVTEELVFCKQPSCDCVDEGPQAGREAVRES